MTRLQRANNAADLRLMARRRLPRPIFDYIGGGADEEVPAGTITMPLVLD